MRMLHCALLIIAVLLPLAGADLSRLRWTPGGGAINASDGDILAMCRLNDDLFVAGDFRVMGGTPLDRIGRWDGSQWHAMGGLDGRVVSLAVDAGGTLWAAGNFTGRIARWNGSAWTPIPGGLGGSTAEELALVAADGGMYVAGGFTAVGGVAAANVAFWNGSVWSPLGAGTNDVVYGMAAAQGGGVHVIGGFTRAGGVDTWKLATWRAGTWACVAAPTFAVSGFPRCVVDTAGGDIVIGGSYDGAALRYRPADSSWATLAHPDSNWLYQLLRLDGEVYAVGWYGIYRLAGSAFVSASSYAYYNSCIASDGAGGLVIGQRTRWNNTLFRDSNLARLEDDDLIPLGLDPLATDGYATALEIDARGRLIAGLTSRTSDGGYQRALGYAWPDRRRWLTCGTSPIFALLGDVAGNGFFAGGQDYAQEQSVLRYADGTLGPIASAGRTVRALCRDAGGDLIAAALSASGTYSLRLWNGVTWSVIGEANGAIDAVLRDGGSVYAGGAFTSIGGISASGLAVWNGTVWQAVPGGPTTVHALSLHPAGGIVAGGSGLARWSGTAWSSLTAPSGTVTALALDDLGNLYAGTESNTIPLARLDGATWVPIPGLVADSVNALHAIRGGGMAVGGKISRVDGSVSAATAFLTGPVSWSFAHDGGVVAPGSLVTVRLTASAPISAMLQDYISIANGSLESFSATSTVVTCQIRSNTAPGGYTDIQVSAGAALDVDGLGTSPSSRYRIPTVQSIAFAPTGQAVYGDELTLSATASSGLPVRLALVSGAGSLSGDRLTILGSTGSVVIDAMQDGDEDTAPAAPVRASIALSPAPLTCTANSLTVSMGSALPALSATWSGFRLGDTAAVLTGTALLATTAVNGSPVGTYPITVDVSGVSAAHYQIAGIAGTLTIEPSTAGGGGGEGGGGGGGGCGAGTAGLALITLLLAPLRRRRRG